MDAQTGKLAQPLVDARQRPRPSRSTRPTTTRPARRTNLDVAPRATRSRAPSTPTSSTRSSPPVSRTGSSRTSSTATPTTATAPPGSRSTTTRPSRAPTPTGTASPPTTAPASPSDDVVAHEWGHAYTEYTSGLIYQWQSGALNESYSDVWGETLDLINNRDDAGEGDVTSKRPDGLCSLVHPRCRRLLDRPRRQRRYLRGRAGGVRSDHHRGRCSPTTSSWPRTPPTGRSVDDRRLHAVHQRRRPSTGNFAYIDRGTCTFQVKVDQRRRPPARPGSSSAPTRRAPLIVDVGRRRTIPGLMITQAKGTEIKAAAAAGPSHGDHAGHRQHARRRTPTAGWSSEKSTAFGGAIRDMWNPNCYGDAGKVSDVQYVCDTDDGGGVHSNSGVAEPHLRADGRRWHVQRPDDPGARPHQGRAHPVAGAEHLRDAGDRVPRAR